MFEDISNWLETTATAGVFLTIGIIALIVLIIGSILDGLFDFEGPVQLEVIGAFFSVFGFLGYILVSSGIKTEIAIIVGVLAAIGAAFLALIITRSLRKENDTPSTVSNATLVGQVATVKLTIPGGTKYGEVSIYSNGMPHPYAALADERIEIGEQVKITSVVTETSVKVTRITPETN